MTARSALGMRAALAWAALVAGVLGAVLILALVPSSGAGSGLRTVGAVACAVVVVVAAVDLVVISRRRRQHR